MNCETVREQLGAYADGELAPEHVAEVERHTSDCPVCAGELRELREMISEFDVATAVKAPPELWQRIEQRLDETAPRQVIPASVFWRRRLVVAAASVAIVIGGGLFAGIWLRSGVETARADEINFEVLLNGLAADVDTAFARFLQYHQAEPIPADTAVAAAPQLRFALPQELPGGFQLQQAYRFNLGSEVGITASYKRGREPLLVFFHRPANKEHLGVQTQMSCLVDGQEVHSVEVGPWRLAHFTDPTTCHCVLSTLDLEKQLPAVFAAVAPDFKTVVHRGGH